MGPFTKESNENDEYIYIYNNDSKMEKFQNSKNQQRTTRTTKVNLISCF